MTIIVTNNLRLSRVQKEFREMLTDKLSFINPKWLENERMGRWNRGTPKKLKYYDKVRNSGLWIPRGFLRRLILMCRRANVEFQLDDQRRVLPDVDFSFDTSLKPYQKRAVTVMNTKDFGTLSAPTGSGKTVMALSMVAHRRQPTLIVVHTKDLAFQWVERIEQFLHIPGIGSRFYRRRQKKDRAKKSQ